jgi:peptide/nickel transport system permease protein
MVIVVLGVVTLTFFMLRLAAGDPARLMNQPGTPEDVAQKVRERLGTDRPLHVQYFEYLIGLTRGDLGTSFHGETTVREMVLAALPNTLILGAVTIVITSTLGALLGVVAALRPNGLIDRLVLMYVTIGQSTPNYWLGVILVLVFAIRLRWLPAIDLTGPKSFVLPVVTLTISLSPVLIRSVRQSFLETMGEDFIRAARARGISERRVLFVHAMKVAAGPLVTLIGLQAGIVLGGAYVVESIFNWPGIGKMTLEAMASRNFPVIQGGVLTTAVVFVLANFMVDLVYAVLDPRIRY